MSGTRRASPRAKVIERVLAAYRPGTLTMVQGGKYLVAYDRRGRGINVVSGTLDRAAVRGVLTENASMGLTSITVYARLCTYSGPAFDFVQINQRGHALDGAA